MTSFVTVVFAQNTPPSAAPSSPQRWVKAVASDQEFYGTWSGMWNKTHAMRFTIGPDASGASGKFSVLYEWQRHRDRPFEKEQVVGLLDGGALVIGKITLFLLEEPDRLLVHGNYRHRPLTAEVVRTDTR